MDKAYQLSDKSPFRGLPLLNGARFSISITLGLWVLFLLGTGCAKFRSEYHTSAEHLAMLAQQADSIEYLAGESGFVILAHVQGVKDPVVLGEYKAGNETSKILRMDELGDRLRIVLDNGFEEVNLQDRAKPKRTYFSEVSGRVLEVEFGDSFIAVANGARGAALWQYSDGGLPVETDVGTDNNMREVKDAALYKSSYLYACDGTRIFVFRIGDSGRLSLMSEINNSKNGGADRIAVKDDTLIVFSGSVENPQNIVSRLDLATPSAPTTL